MAKKQKISDKIQAKFNKPQFRIGDAVFFTWLGQKQIGYVLRIKQASWGISYTVESTSGTRYPCGIQIQGQKTQYNTGFIQYEESRSTDDAEFKRRIEIAKTEDRSATVFRNFTRPDTKSTIRDTSSNTNDANDIRKDNKVRTNRSAKSNVVSSSVRGNGATNTKKRKVAAKSELDAAIDRQKSFLDFTKPVKKD